MRFSKLQFRSKLVRLFKITIALTRESGDYVGADSYAGNKLSGCRDNIVVALTVITSCHASKNMVRSALHGKVKMTTHARIFPKFQPFKAKIFWLERGNTYTTYISFM